jgi:hypothetical protein
VEGLLDPPVFCEALAERGGVALAAEHPQQVIGADLVGDQRACHAEHVRPLLPDLAQVDLVPGDRLQRPVVPDLAVGYLGAPEPLVGQVAEARRESEAEHLEDAEDDVGVYVDSSS